MSLRPSPPVSAGFAVALLACLIAPATLLWWSPAQAQVNRCMTSDGITLYTDRRCTDVGAMPGPVRMRAGGSGSGRIHRGGCARNLQDLVYEMTSAIDSGDVNRLASVYHWTGMSGSAGYAVMARLGAVVKRPLVDIVAVMPPGPDGEDGWLYPQTTVQSAPVALRVEQTLANRSTPSRTVFGMHRHFGCYWIRG